MSNSNSISNSKFRITTNHKTQTTNNSHSPLLDLPIELRFNIYTYLLPPSQPLTINHCHFRSEARLPTHHKLSPIAHYLESRRFLTEWCWHYGLHLPQVCRQLRDEVLGVIRRQCVRVEGHCTECLGKVMGCLREQGLAGRGRSYLKEWWVRVTVEPATLGVWASAPILGDVEALKAVVEGWFGGMGLVAAAALRGPEGRTGRGAPRSPPGGGVDDDCRFWYCEGIGEVKRDREFVVEHVRIIGRRQRGRKRKRRNGSFGRIHDDDGDGDGEMDVEDEVHDFHDSDDDSAEEGDDHDSDDDTDHDEDDDDDDDDNDNNNAPFTLNLRLPRPYNHEPTVMEVERRTKRFDPDRPEQQARIIGMTGPSRAFLVTGDVSEWWRESGELNREYGRGKGWYIREEVWIGCSFR